MDLAQYVVRVECNNKLGSGFFVSGGFLLTARHILSGNLKKTKFTIRDHITEEFRIDLKPERSFEEIELYDKEEGDLIVIKLSDELYQKLKHRSLELSINNSNIEELETYGFPEGWEKNGLPWNKAEINSLKVNDSYGVPKMILANPGEIKNGFSGSPIFDRLQGKVIGMILQRGGEAAAGLPTSYLITCIESLERKLRYDTSIEKLVETSTKSLNKKLVKIELFVEALDENWKSVFESVAGEKIFNYEKILGIERLNCANSDLINLNPLSHIQGLRSLDCKMNPISDLAPLQYNKNLNFLNCSGTDIDDLNPIRNLKNLNSLIISNTKIRSLKPIFHLENLVYLNCMNIKIPNAEIREFRYINSSCKLII